MAQITFKKNPVTLVGKEVNSRRQAPNLQC